MGPTIQRIPRPPRPCHHWDPGYALSLRSAARVRSSRQHAPWGPAGPKPAKPRSTPPPSPAPTRDSVTLLFVETTFKSLNRRAGTQRGLHQMLRAPSPASTPEAGSGGQHRVSVATVCREAMRPGEEGVSPRSRWFPESRAEQLLARPRSTHHPQQLPLPSPPVPEAHPETPWHHVLAGGAGPKWRRATCGLP